MSGPDAVSEMLETLDFSHSQTAERAAGEPDQRPTEREVALHTMLSHSGEEASAEFLLQGKFPEQKERSFVPSLY